MLISDGRVGAKLNQARGDPITATLARAPERRAPFDVGGVDLRAALDQLEA